MGASIGSRSLIGKSAERRDESTYFATRSHTVHRIGSKPAGVQKATTPTYAVIIEMEGDLRVRRVGALDRNGVEKAAETLAAKNPRARVYAAQRVGMLDGDRSVFEAYASFRG